MGVRHHHVVVRAEAAWLQLVLLHAQRPQLLTVEPMGERVVTGVLRSCAVLDARHSDRSAVAADKLSAHCHLLCRNELAVVLKQPHTVTEAVARRLTGVCR